MKPPRSKSSCPIRYLAGVVACVFTICAAFPWRAEPGSRSFTYDPISEPILSATFSGDFAALTAHRTVFGFEVNRAILLGLGGGEFNLSEALFGTADALLGPANIDQGLLGTGIVSAAIDPSFFPDLAKGAVGLLATFTDTFDGLFAIDFLSLTIVTSNAISVAAIDSNDGFGIGIPDEGMLPAPLPTSIPIGATGTGFDEAISSISFQPAPEPATIILLCVGLGLFGILSRRAYR